MTYSHDTQVQNHESGAFLALWKKHGGIRYLEGGVDSAFNHVEPESYKTKLFHIKGKRACRVMETPCCSASLNEGDAFVLDCGLKIVVWKGKSCNKYEEQKAMEVARALRDERGAKPVVVHFKDAGAEERAEFWTELGGEGKVASAEEGGCDELQEKAGLASVKLWTLDGEKFG